MMHLHSNISHILKSQGRTNAWFYRQMGVSEALFYAIERGARRPKEAYRQKAAALLQLPEAVLFSPAVLSNDSKYLSPEAVPV